MRSYAFAPAAALLCMVAAQADTVTAVVRGTVFACDSGAPHAGAVVEVRAADGTRTAVADARGHFVLVGLAPGTHRIGAARDTAGIAAVRVALDAGDVVVADIGWNPALAPSPRTAVVGCSPRPFFEPPTVDRYTVR